MTFPPNKKKIARVNDEENMTSSSEEESDEEMDQINGEELMCTFEGRNPLDEDHHGIKQLLQQLFITAPVNLSELTQMIIDQQGLGSVMCQALEDDECEDELNSEINVFGIVTVVNLTANMQNTCVKQLFELITSLSKEHATNDVQNEIEKIVKSPTNKIGIFINERFINLPIKICEPFLSSLSQELERVKSRKADYAFTHLIMIMKANKPKDGSKTWYTNPEEELFVEGCSATFEFSVEKQCDTSSVGKWTEEDSSSTPYRRVVVLTYDHFKNTLPKISEFIKTSYPDNQTA